MNFEVLKQISEYFYVDFKDITDGIKTKNENINNKFRIAFEELLCQINNVYSFIPDGSSFYNRIVNNYDFQMHMINKYKCDSKLMGCLRKIQKLGNETTHNSLKVFDENDVRDHRSPYGEIVSRWEWKGKCVHYEVTVPANSTATLTLPDKAENVRVVELAAGRYEFIVK